ncbi:MAG: lysophospholipid acyltransferase family protein [Clostridiaceae bacterium]
MNRLLWYGYFVLYLVWSLRFKIKLFFIKKKSKEKAEEYAYVKIRNMANYILKITKSQVEVKGLENIPDGSCVFVANHQAIFDGFLILKYIDKPYVLVAKKEIQKLPIINSWMKEISTIFIDRANVRESLKSINKGVSYINEGYSVVIFPEGTRSLGGAMNEFKKGSMKLALKSNVPIVPIVIDGTYKVLETGKKVRGHNLKMTVLNPIYTENLSKEEKNKLSLNIHDLIEEELFRMS